MNAHVPIPVEAAAIEARFAGLCDNRAQLYIEGVLDLHEAVDECHGYAVLGGIVDHLGQDETQHIMAVAFAATDLLPDIEQVHFQIGDLVRRWEIADSRDRWRHTGEAPPHVVEHRSRPPPYETSPSTISAFWHVVRNERDKLEAWLARHDPRDAQHLLKLWKAKRCSS
jgi:hypothetical protein